MLIGGGILRTQGEKPGYFSPPMFLPLAVSAVLSAVRVFRRVRNSRCRANCRTDARTVSAEGTLGHLGPTRRGQSRHSLAAPFVASPQMGFARPRISWSLGPVEIEDSQIR